MVLTDEQKEYLRPMMEEYEKFIRVSTMSFNEFGRIVQVYKEHGVTINYCNTCGDDKLKFIVAIYNLWK